jgi:hypothetical protein
MCQAALPETFPGLRATIAITDQKARPIPHKLCKRGFGTMPVELKGRHRWVRHHPQPVPVAMHQPRGLVKRVAQGGARDLANGSVMGQDRLSDPTPHLLHHSLPQWDAQH